MLKKWGSKTAYDKQLTKNERRHLEEVSRKLAQEAKKPKRQSLSKLFAACKSDAVLFALVQKHRRVVRFQCLKSGKRVYVWA